MKISSLREYLKELRTQKGLTMQQVADSIGMSRQYYQYIEAGKRQQKMDVMLINKLATVFSVPVEQIVNAEIELMGGVNIDRSEAT